MPFRDTFVCPGHPPPHPFCPTRQSLRIPRVRGELRTLFTVLGCTEGSFVLFLPCTEGGGGAGVVSTSWLIAQLLGRLPGSLPGVEWGPFPASGVLQGHGAHGAFEYLSVALKPCQ